MVGSIEVDLDEQRQIIVQVFRGALSSAQFDAMGEQTRTLGDTLAEPERVRVLLDAGEMENMSRSARKRSVETAKDPNAVGFAVWGAKLPVHAGCLFSSMMAGRDVVRVLRTEADAVAWLTGGDEERRNGR